MAAVIVSEKWVANDYEIKRVLGPELLQKWTRKAAENLGFQEFMGVVFCEKPMTDALVRVRGETGEFEEIPVHQSILKYFSEFFDACLSDRWSNNATIDLTCYDFTFLTFNSFLQVCLRYEN